MVTTQNNPSAVLSVPLFGPGGNATKADPTDARVTNRLLIFGALFPRTLLSRAAIARKTGLSKMAVTKVVQELIDEHLLKESGQEEKNRWGHARNVVDRQSLILEDHYR